MPILSHEAIGEGARKLYLLHGIFGMGRNWASVARRLVRERREWTVRLLDLRQHGASQGFGAPHTLASAAGDIAYLARELGEQPEVVLGHSFGGKVALMYAREHGEGLRQVWLIDSTPDARAPAGSAWQMLELIRNAPSEYGARDELIAYLMERGVAQPTALWMATNLQYTEGRYRWRFDFVAIEALLRSFFAEDLWPVVERPASELQVHIVKAIESSVLTPEAIARVGAAEANGAVHFHEVEGGHWLNADNPGALHDLLLAHL